VQWRYHRLNGSSSHCVNGNISFLWESQKFDPHRIETPDLIEIKFGTVDYVGEMTPGAKFHANPSMGGFLANG